MVLSRFSVGLLDRLFVDVVLRRGNQPNRRLACSALVSGGEISKSLINI